MPSNAHIRTVMLFLFFSGLYANQSYEKVYYERATVRSTVYNWFSKFKNGDYLAEDEDRSGRQRRWIWTCFETNSKELDLDGLRNQVED